MLKMKGCLVNLNHGVPVILMTLITNTVLSFAFELSSSRISLDVRKSFRHEYHATNRRSSQGAPLKRGIYTSCILPKLESSSEGEEADELDYISPMRQRPRPKGGDVAYTNENILRQQTYYRSIRTVGGIDCVLDVYARDPSTSGTLTKFWFVGKVARCTGTVSAEAAIARQFNLLEEHACRIRPIELGRCFGKLELYSAPGDTEIQTSQNDARIRLIKMSRVVEGSENVSLLEVGVNFEIVTNQGEGFYILRTEDGVVPPFLIQ